MQIKQVAELLGVDKKEVIEEVESHREEFVAQGFKLAKKLTASSALDESLVKRVLANFDVRQQESAEKEREEQQRREREEAERRRAADELKRKEEEEKRRAQAEAARQAAEAEFKRRQMELARRQEEARRQAEQQLASPAPLPPHAPQAPQAPRKPQTPPATPAQKAQQAARPEPAPAPAARKEAPPQRRDESRTAPTAKKGEKGERPAKEANLQAFVEQGIQSDVEDTYRRQRRTRGKAGPKAKERGKERPDGEKPRRKPAPADLSEAKKRIRPSQIFNLESVMERRGKSKRRSSQGGGRHDRHAQEQKPKEITLRGDFTVGEFAEKAHLPVNEVMAKLFAAGKMMTINNLLEPDLAEELALEFEIEINIQREDDVTDIAEFDVVDDESELRSRPPVVTVMGHVDHGKTSLLDRIRKADVASSEFGGITQHIGAYNVSTPKGDVVFLDTPGHEAFTEMRSRGANVTDMVVLVVAANDGVMPQTVEAINHAKAAGVPIMVAINKIDVQGSSVERVKQELLKYDLVPEEYGGDTIMVPVSAETGEGIDSLLEYMALQNEMLELQANPSRAAIGTVVESNIDPTRGAVATVLVQKGTLRVGDYFVTGTEYGRVRAMRDERNKMLKEAGPSRPVEILGLHGSPIAGETFVVVESESQAREIAEARIHRRRLRKGTAKQHVTLDNLADQMSDGDVITLNLIVKADVQGSVEAITQALYKIKSDKVLIKVIHAAVGAVSVSDVQLADASGAIILAFNVSIDPASRDMSEEMKIDIRSYQVIYALLEDIEKAMMGMLAPVYEEKEEGRAKVLQTFKVSKIGTIAGCFVEEGNIAITHKARLVRDGVVIWRGKLKSLRRVKENVRQVQSGLECGIGLENYNDIKEGDILEFFSMEEQEVTLISNDQNRKPAESVS